MYTSCICPEIWNDLNCEFDLFYFWLIVIVPFPLIEKKVTRFVFLRKKERWLNIQEDCIQFITRFPVFLTIFPRGL